MCQTRQLSDGGSKQCWHTLLSRVTTPSPWRFRSIYLFTKKYRTILSCNAHDLKAENSENVIIQARRNIIPLGLVFSSILLFVSFSKKRERENLSLIADCSKSGPCGLCTTYGAVLIVLYFIDIKFGPDCQVDNK